jgi:hypothetical protein
MYVYDDSVGGCTARIEFDGVVQGEWLIVALMPSNKDT